MTLSVRDAAREHGERTAYIDRNVRLSFRELCERIVTPSSVPAVIEGAVELGRVLEILGAIEAGCPIVLLHPRWSLAEKERARAEAALVTDASLLRDVLAILYTSGTTGVPKGALLSRAAFISSAQASAQVIPLGPDDRWLLCMPLAHVGGLSILTRCLIARACVVNAGPFEPIAVIEALERERATLASLVPTMLSRVLDAGGGPALARLRAVLLGGAACPSSLLDRALAAGIPIRTTYGLTEACSQVTTSRSAVHGLDDGAGEALPGYELRFGADGAIAVRAPSLLSGWLRDGRAVPALDPEGFYDTGDLGVLDPRGRLHLHARRADLIITGGENVYPAEVERALEALPGVRAACVFGVSDPEWGQIVAAAIVGEAEVLEAIEPGLRATLARFKIPRRAALVAELAVHPSGKLDRAGTAARAGPQLVAVPFGDHPR